MGRKAKISISLFTAENFARIDNQVNLIVVRQVNGVHKIFKGSRIDWAELCKDELSQLSDDKDFIVS